MNRISHPDWVKLCVELNYAPNKNCFYGVLEDLAVVFFRFSYVGGVVVVVGGFRFSVSDSICSSYPFNLLASL